LIGAMLRIKEILTTGAVSNVYGFFSLTISEGKYTIIYSHIGCHSVSKKININIQGDAIGIFSAQTVSEMTLIVK